MSFISPFVSGLLPLAQRPQGPSMWLHVSEFALLGINNISLYAYNIFCLFTHLSVPSFKKMNLKDSFKKMNLEKNGQ